MRVMFGLIALGLTGCSMFYPPQTPPTPPDNREEVTWVVEKQMAKWRYEPHRKLRLEHAYVYYTDVYKGLRLEISSQEILEVREARQLLVDFVEELLMSLNTDPIIAADLELGQMTPSELDIEISFDSFFGIYVDPFYVGYIKLREGMARYYAFDLKKEGWPAWHSRVEPYAKTREIAVLERAAAEEYEEANSYERELDRKQGEFRPVNIEEIRHPSPLRKF